MWTYVGWSMWLRIEESGDLLVTPRATTKTYPTPLPLARKIRVFQKSSSIGLNPERVAVSAARSGERAKNSAGGTAATAPTPPAEA